MRKLLSTDIDGTLLFNATISPTDLAAVTRWRDAGNLLVPNTGRPCAATTWPSTIPCSTPVPP